METFTWHPAIGNSVDIEPKVNVTSFGDGYELRAVDGINNQKQVWSLTFEGTRTDMEAIAKFLKARGAHEAFRWVTPDHVIGHEDDLYNVESHEITVVCRKWSRTRNTGWQQITCTFEQVFEY